MTALGPSPYVSELVVREIGESTDVRQLLLLRRCVRCGEWKTDAEYHVSRTGQFSYCAACRREYDRSHYHAGGKVPRLARKATQRSVGRDWLNSLKRGIACADCGEAYPQFVMHFDHLPGEQKVDHVSHLARERSRDRALAEMAKCELVCANCHAIRTSERRRSKRK